jgi:hypothetical protein
MRGPPPWRAQVGEKLAQRAKKFIAMRKAEKAKTQPSACEAAARQRQR